MSKILILAGSPRMESKTNKLAEIFARSCKEKGNDAIIHYVRSFDEQPCIACNRCFTDGKACVINDDFNVVAELMEDADILYFFVPMYWTWVPAPMKNVIDHFYSMGGGQGLSHTNISKMGMIMSAELPITDKEYSIAKDMWDYMLDYLSPIENLGYVPIGELRDDAKYKSAKDQMIALAKRS